VFAVLLLVWTTADLCGGLCVHDHEPITELLAAGADGARRLASKPDQTTEHPAHPPDDCFCCSHYVQPQVRYRFVPAHTFLSLVEPPAVPRPKFPASKLYHPPLARGAGVPACGLADL